MGLTRSETALLALMAATVLSVVFLNMRHALSFHRPALQTAYMRMLLVPAVLSPLSFISVMMPHLGMYLTALGELVDAFSLYSYFAALVLFAGGEKIVCEIYEQAQPNVFCKCCSRPDERWTGERMFALHKKLVAQNMVVKPAVTLLAELALQRGLPRQALFPINLLGGASIVVLMRTLYVVYQTNKHRLHGMGAKAKFAVVKIAVAVLLLQGQITSMLVTFGKISGSDALTAEEKATKLVGTLGVCEMFVFTMLFAAVFSSTDKSLAQPHSAADQLGAANTAPLASPVATPDSPATAAGQNGKKPSMRLDHSVNSNGEHSTNGEGHAVALAAPNLGACAACKALWRFWDYAIDPLEERGAYALLANQHANVASDNYTGEDDV